MRTWTLCCCFNVWCVLLQNTCLSFFLYQDIMLLTLPSFATHGAMPLLRWLRSWTRTRASTSSQPPSRPPRRRSWCSSSASWPSCSPLCWTTWFWADKLLLNRLDWSWKLKKSFTFNRVVSVVHLFGGFWHPFESQQSIIPNIQVFQGVFLCEIQDCGDRHGVPSEEAGEGRLSSHQTGHWPILFIHKLAQDEPKNINPNHALIYTQLKINKTQSLTQFWRIFFHPKKITEKDDQFRMKLGGLVVVASNAGGAWTPMGDITTTMLYIGGQVTTVPLLGNLLFPSIMCCLAHKKRGLFWATWEKLHDLFKRYAVLEEQAARISWVLVLRSRIVENELWKKKGIPCNPTCKNRCSSSQVRWFFPNSILFPAKKNSKNDQKLNMFSRNDVVPITFLAQNTLKNCCCEAWLAPSAGSSCRWKTEPSSGPRPCAEERFWMVGYTLHPKIGSVQRICNEAVWWLFVFPQQQHLLWGLQPRIALGRSGAAATPGSGEGSGGFRRVPGQMADEVPESSGVDC